MYILAPKLVLLLYVILIFLTNSIVIAQPAFFYHTCQNAANYTRSSSYQSNLDSTLSILPETNTGLGFFNSSTGQGNNTVHSVALCRGDLEANLCRSCLDDSIAKLPQVCPNQQEAIGYYDNCLLMYSNQDILGNTDKKYFGDWYNNENVSDIDLFNGALIPLLNELRVNAAAGSWLLKFASGNLTGDFITIYGLAQCTPDLREQQCSDCLKDLINRLVVGRRGKIGGRILSVKCNFRYEIYRFFNGSTLAIPPPPVSSPSPNYVTLQT